MMDKPKLQVIAPAHENYAAMIGSEVGINMSLKSLYQRRVGFDSVSMTTGFKNINSLHKGIVWNYAAEVFISFKYSQ